MLKYQQIKSAIAKQFEGLDADLPLPTIRELMEMHQVSLATMNTALKSLEEEGLIRRERGRGIFYNGRRADVKAFYAIVIDEITGMTQAHLVDSFEKVMYAENKKILVMQSRLDRGTENLRQLESERLAGVLAAPSTWDAADENYIAKFQQLQSEGIPIVLVDQSLPGIDADYIGIDSSDAFHKATRKCLKQGCRKLSFVCRSDSALFAKRLQGVQQAIAGSDTQLDFINPEEHANELERIAQSIAKRGSDVVVIAQAELAQPLDFQIELINRESDSKIRSIAILEEGLKLAGRNAIAIEKPTLEMGKLATQYLLQPRAPRQAARVQFLKAQLK